MDSRIIYTVAITGILWCHTAYGNAVVAAGSDQYTQAKTLKSIFKGVEDRRLSLLEESINGLDANGSENYFAELEFANADDISGMGANAKSKIHYEYDNDFNKIEVNIQRWDDKTHTWIKSIREMSYYNNNGTLHESNYQSWGIEKAQWNTVCREVYSYDRNDNLTQADLQWQDENGAWSNLGRSSYRYNSEGYLNEHTVQQYDPKTKVWTNITRKVSAYDEEGYEIENTLQKGAGKKDWNNKQRTTYEYATDPELKRAEVVATHQKWHDKYWTNTVREADSHDDNLHQSETISQYWNNDAAMWDNQHRKLKIYSENGHITATEQYYWNTATGTWENATRTLHIYDEKNRLSEMIDQQWKGDTQKDWSNTAHTKLSYANETVLDNP